MREREMRDMRDMRKRERHDKEGVVYALIQGRARVCMRERDTLLSTWYVDQRERLLSTSPNWS